MSWNARVDANQAVIVAALRDVGATVCLTHRLGGGFPDLCVGFRGETYLLEVKTEKGKLNEKEQEWHDIWRGQVAVVRDIDDALRAIGVEYE